MRSISPSFASAPAWRCGAPGLVQRHQPDRVVDDLISVLHRAHATAREVRLLLALIRNLGGWP